MGINKAFVVKNSLEVSNNLILANADTRKVGIGTTIPTYDFTVAGGIGATDFYLTGIGTFANELQVGLGGTVLTVLGIGGSIGIGTTLPEYLLDIRSPVSTGQTALYVQGDVRITGDLIVDDITFDDATLSNLTVTEALNVTSPGISTFGGYVDVNANADFSGTINVVGLSTLGGYVDINNSVDISTDLNVSGITTLSTADINAGEIDVTRIETGDLSVTGIATIATISVVGAALSNLIVSGIATLGTVDINGGDIEVSNVDTTDLNVTGISTLGTVEISSGIITAISGIVTYYGDGQHLDLTSNPSTGIGIATVGGTVGTGATVLDFRGAGISTVTVASGIGTIFIQGGGGDRFTTITPNQTTNKTIVNKEFCLVTSAGVTITLPASPSAGAEVAVGVTTGITNTIIGRNSQNIMSLAEDLTIDVANVVVTLVYSDSTRGWRIV